MLCSDLLPNSTLKEIIRTIGPLGDFFSIFGNAGKSQRCQSSFASQFYFPVVKPCPSLPVKSRKPSLGDLILRHTNSPTRARHAAQLALAHVRDGGQSLHSALFRGSGGASGLEKQAEALRVKNAVYCAVIFCEFLKELAALTQEHAVSLPFPHSQEAEE